MRIQFLQDFIDKVRNKRNRLSFQSKIYGKCYYPYYSKKQGFSFKKPRIFNEFGEPLELFFLRSSATWYSPYNDSRYFLWDRYNFGLDIHFYTDNDIFQTMGKPNAKYALFGEPRTINKKVYSDFVKAKNLASEFKNIITFDSILLEKFPNARLFCGAAPWCYLESGDTLSHSATKYEKKSKDISMICSGKTFTPLHIVRNAIASRLKSNARVDIFGSYVNNYVRYTSQALDSYRYHIVVENMQSEYYFTEKILNCFISMAVPLYIGATKIAEFFNPDGIITLRPNDVDNIESILAACTPQDYTNRLPAIIENYHKSLHYLNNDDRLYEMLFKGDK
ncbi:hypothetical protein DCO58_05625 [Helicobacter saguini]|uniref:Fucosyltransferase C-terminal domain-containing protein n=1 Tax=Helicobacter saguini TaxID=1548018 RepID=A0A347VTA9_9HELI|nr:glycosyltransferase family 10 [Helicobacter saguini]MWV62173.1 hypothetical protein [Helicobacter saguini]MWV67154.1 hypothetical protein [Helicobacter saguini]MWV69506.1 hypothetical protein [Helicobacter saguini]MWV70943.1 hypothetical protein [Helicobacter saguini]TLD92523.1 hypothetical protein LS64_010050 [Helicobacter saguini]